MRQHQHGATKEAANLLFAKASTTRSSPTLLGLLQSVDCEGPGRIGMARLGVVVASLIPSMLLANLPRFGTLANGFVDLYRQSRQGQNPKIEVRHRAKLE